MAVRGMAVWSVAVVAAAERAIMVAAALLCAEAGVLPIFIVYFTRMVAIIGFVIAAGDLGHERTVSVRVVVALVVFIAISRRVVVGVIGSASGAGSGRQEPGAGSAAPRAQPPCQERPQLGRRSTSLICDRPAGLCVKWRRRRCRSHGVLRVHVHNNVLARARWRGVLLPACCPIAGRRRHYLGHCAGGL